MCPDCRLPLAILELHGVEIDRCFTCGGTWLDAGELEAAVEAAGRRPEALSARIQRAARGKWSRRRCPRCRRRLRAIVLEERPGLELDVCPRGDGVWLDRGELEALLRSAGEGEGAQLARFLKDLYATELTPGGPGKEGA